MRDYSRLFDCITEERIGQKDILLAGKIDGAYKGISGKEVIKQVDELCNGLIQYGIHYHDNTVEGRDKIGLISNSRTEWLVTDLAVQKSGAILVPLYPNTNPDEIIYVFNEAQVKMCFVSNKAIYDKLKSIQEEIPSLEQIVPFDELEGVKSWNAYRKQPNEAEAAEIKRRSDQIKEDDVATIIYTSGTTGKPKGVMLSHKNIVSNVKNVEHVITAIPVENKKSLSFLPLNHIFEKTVSYIYLFNAYSIYYAESMETIGDNLKEVQPSLFVTVPRLLEKVYEKIMSKGEQLSGIKKQLFFWAVGLGNKYTLHGRSAFYNLQLSLANKLIFSKWREALGGNVKAIIVGGAACPPRLARLFTAGQIPIMEGYGLTETSPVIAVNEFDPHKRMFGTVGPVIPNVEVKILDDGEIVCRGDNVMVGYYKNPEQTAETIKDGWLYTGDIGALVDGKFLKITDRKKELFKTSGGKYVAPQIIETKLKESRLIEQVMVLGADEKYVGALIVPNFENLKAWMQHKNLTFTSNEDVFKLPEVRDKFKRVLEKYNENFNPVEQVKRFRLLPKEFSVEGGEMTPKLSLKRKKIMEKYHAEIDKIYKR